MNIELLKFITLVLLFILGTAFGSFLSVLINRTLNDEKGIFFGKSKCPHCKHQLLFLDLIPLFSYFFSGGKCRYCFKKISIEYPLLELTTGILFVTNFLLIESGLSDFSIKSGNITTFSLNYIFLNLISLVIISIVFSDIKTKEIPNSFLYSWVLICIFAPLITQANSIWSILAAIIISLLFFGGQWLVSKVQWLGSGDIYIGIGMALLLGVEKFLVAIFFTYLIASILSLILIGLKVLNRKSTIAFAPFLSLGTLIALYFGNSIYMWYLSSNILFIY